MSIARFASIALFAGAMLGGCSKDSVAPPPWPPAEWSKFALLGGDGFGIARSNDGHLLATLINAGYVERVLLSNASAQHEAVSVGGTPSVIATSPNGGVFYVANMAGWVEARNSGTGEPIATFELSDAHSLTVSPDGARLYVTGSAGHLYVLNATTLVPIDTVSIPGGPWGIAFRTVGSSNRLLVTARDAGTITEIDRATNAVLHIYNVGGRPHGLVITPDGKRLFAADNQASAIKVIDASTGGVTGQIPFDGAFGLAISPDGRTIYASGDNGLIGFLDVSKATLDHSWATDGQPRQIVTSANGDTAYFANTYGWIDRVTR